ncbi:hypothetical protein M2282_005063 [Variovorax boronicumulans]|uniref:hypothetical protein n=1 Tax=Variovorax boronicumulans TaxID=436515 RepID=UPI00247700A3|nr:hypothetical protein [Variovorax boronicumulans]MDH6169893.1 hypothetical protein [Variovorax boronicumulans]
MTKPASFASRVFLWSFFAAGLVAAAAAPQVHAQPSGNPKGSAAPSMQGNSEKKPANPARTVDTGRSEPLDESKGPTEMRGRTQRPGGGSATGGLTRRNPQEQSQSQAQPSVPTTAPPPGDANARPGR